VSCSRATRRGDLGLGLDRRLHRRRRDARAATLLALGQLGAQVVVLRGQTTQLGDDLVQEVVHLALVVAAAELRGSEVLVEDILGR
jgi:hypothetical protein